MKERIEKELMDLDAQERQLMANINAVLGAKQVLKKLLQEITAVEVPPEDISMDPERC